MICLDLKISDDIFKKITKEYNRNVRINSLHNRQRENNGRCDFYRLTVIPQGVYGRYPKQQKPVGRMDSGDRLGYNMPSIYVEIR